MLVSFLYLAISKPNLLMRKSIFLSILIVLSNLYLQAQKPQTPSSLQIYESIQKLNFLGSVLYVAAHPDDENTRLIAYMANHTKARTAYLSLTRGDGGQNLIGPEIRELLGVIRTQELLAARRIDGGEQLFTRANDFGYSKHPDETLHIWNKDLVLSDVVYAIRKFKPDVIINRFDHRTSGTTHGHHTASALLSIDAKVVVVTHRKFSKEDYIRTISNKYIHCQHLEFNTVTNGSVFVPFGNYVNITNVNSGLQTLAQLPQVTLYDQYQ